MGFLGAAVTPVVSGDFGRHLLGELRELLGLRGHRLELLASMRVDSSMNSDGDFTPNSS
jgi:hypothetical protein